MSLATTTTMSNDFFSKTYIYIIVLIYNKSLNKNTTTILTNDNILCVLQTRWKLWAKLERFENFSQTLLRLPIYGCYDYKLVAAAIFWLYIYSD